MEPNLNIVTFALFCLPKSIFSHTILRLVISTWLNNHGWTTLELKPCHCVIWKLAIDLRVIFFAIYGTKREWNIRSGSPALFAVWNSVSTQCILLSFLSCLNANLVQTNLIEIEKMSLFFWVKVLIIWSWKYGAIEWIFKCSLLVFKIKINWDF